MNKKKIIFFTIMVLVLLASSIGVYSQYDHIEKKCNESKEDIDISNYLIDDLIYNTYALRQDFNESNNQSTDVQQYFNKETLTQLSQDELNDFDKTINGYRRNLNDNQNFQYFAIDLTTHKTLSNSKNDLKSLETNTDLQKQYWWYAQYTFDEKGNITIQYQKDNIKSHLVSDFINNLPVFNFISNEDGYNQSIAPHQMTIIFAVPQTLDQDSGLYYDLQNISRTTYLKYALPFIFLASLACILSVLITPIKILKDNRFLSGIADIKFEFLSFIWCVIMLIMMNLSSIVIPCTIQNQWIILYKELGIENIQSFLTPCLNISFWFIFFALIMLLIYMIKYLFHKGITRYFFENTCVGWIITHFKIILNKAVNFNLSDSTNKVVFRIVLINFVIISCISCFFIFGIFFSFLYSLIIFVILKKTFSNIQNDYKILLDATKQLSNGNFNAEINEDVGVFNPLKEEFSHIKEGFEKAVQEEVKSQKTKTELISNVSHDLKTPLTSIITYVDLLKTPDLSQENYTHYLQVLERNSLRLKNLIEDLFEVSRANTGDIKLDFIDVDIVSLIKQAQLECQDKLLEKNLDLKITFASEKVICSLDSSKTYRIFENLFINICKYALDNTRVYLDLYEDADKVVITFKNISADEMHFNENEIIERFVQGDKSRNTSGSGLGLAIVKSFTELQGGQFNVEIDGDLFKSILIFNRVEGK